MVRTKGLEPPRLASLEPKSSASTNSATPACHNPLRKARAPSISQFSPQPRIGACKYCDKAWARWLRPPRSPRGLGCSLLQGMGAENQRANGIAAGGGKDRLPEAARTARRRRPGQHAGGGQDSTPEAAGDRPPKTAKSKPGKGSGGQACGAATGPNDTLARTTSKPAASEHRLDPTDRHRSKSKA